MPCKLQKNVELLDEIRTVAVTDQRQLIFQRYSKSKPGRHSIQSLIAYYGLIMLAEVLELARRKTPPGGPDRLLEQLKQGAN